MSAVKNYIDQNKDRFIEELISLLKIPSVSADKTYEKEIGAWGERFAFNNLAKELIKKHKGNKFTIDREKQKLQIFNSKGKQLVLFENRNVQKLTQSGYDFLLSTIDCDFYIEVKTTTRSGSAKFNLEEKQWDCCRKNKDKFILVIVRSAGCKTAVIQRIPNLYKRYENGQIYIKPGRMTFYIKIEINENRNYAG